jgi:hypothetical protein
MASDSIREKLRSFRRIKILGCGSAYYGQLGSSSRIWRASRRTRRPRPSSGTASRSSSRTRSTSR